MPEPTPINANVSLETIDAVALIRIDNPPVNACSLAVRQGLVDAVRAANNDADVQAIAIYAAGRTFVAGADIHEFGKPALPPALPDLCSFIEASAKPVIAVLHGTTLGGGLEIGLAAHARIGVAGLRVGLPEILLGLMPGAGATQRAPRLIGIASTLDMALSGRQVGAEEALNMGLIDRIATGAPRDIALAGARDVVAGKLATRRTGDLPVTKDDPALDTARAMVAKKMPHITSARICIDAIAMSTGPIAPGLAFERQAFVDMLETPSGKGMVHAFIAERAVAKTPEADAAPRDIAIVGVIGGGTMGSGIATAALMAGLQVRLIEVAPDALERGVATITKNLDGAVARNKLSATARDAALSRLSPATDMASLADADLVIEAVFENMAVKTEIFTALDGICKPGAVLASNTSYLDINEIAAATSRPGDVIGLHFFSPAHIMRLLEIVVTDTTAPDVVATGFALAHKLRKVGVRAGVCDGFIGNRILSHYGKVLTYMLMDGADPAVIDAALEDFGLAMGPFKVSDLAGLDIGWAERKRKAPSRPANERYVPIADRICEQGWFGRKTGTGYYLYDGGTIRPNPEAQAIIDAERHAAGITAHAFAPDEIVDRYMTAMICEAARVVEDVIALRPIDVDAVFLFGYGFPRFRGGPLHYADSIGAAELVARIETYAAEDPIYWQVPPILRRMAGDSTTFSSLNEAR